MSQTFDVNKPQTGVTTIGQLYQVLRDHFAALRSGFSGTSFPSGPIQGQFCLRTDRGTYGAWYVYTGSVGVGESGWISLESIQPEIVTARGSAASIGARLGVAINADGTLKTTPPGGAWWVTEANAVEYSTASAFKVTGDLTAIYLARRHLLLDGAETVVVSSSYSGGTGKTTVNVHGAPVPNPLTAVEYGPPPLQESYAAGTVDVTNGDATITGTSTKFATQVSAGDIFVGPDGAAYAVDSVTDDTHLELTVAYAGGTLTGQAYTIYPVAHAPQYHPKGVRPAYGFVSASDAFSITSDTPTYSDVDDMSITISVQGPYSVVMVDFACYLYRVGGSMNGDFCVSVDGSDISASAMGVYGGSVGSDYTANVALNYAVTGLTRGSHTIKIRGRRYGGLSLTGLHRSMRVVEVA